MDCYDGDVLRLQYYEVVCFGGGCGFATVPAAERVPDCGMGELLANSVEYLLHVRSQGLFRHMCFGGWGKSGIGDVVYEAMNHGYPFDIESDN